MTTKEKSRRTADDLTRLFEAAANRGSRHETYNLSTQSDNFRIIKKSLTHYGSYSGYEYELLNHYYTFNISFAPVCKMQTGAFCIFSKLFGVNPPKPPTIWGFFGLRVYERGHFKIHCFRGCERG